MVTIVHHSTETSIMYVKILTTLYWGRKIGIVSFNIMLFILNIKF